MGSVPDPKLTIVFSLSITVILSCDLLTSKKARSKKNQISRSQIVCEKISQNFRHEVPAENRLEDVINEAVPASHFPQLPTSSEQ